MDVKYKDATTETHPIKHKFRKFLIQNFGLIGPVNVTVTVV